MGRFDKDSLGNRMKRYEQAAESYLVPKEDVIIRLDGSHFHTITRRFKKPFDEVLMDTMQRTMFELCQDTQNTVFAYTQSDEITMVLKIKDIIKSEEYFDGKLNKILSITASKCSVYFNKYLQDNIILLKMQPDYYKERSDIQEYKKQMFNAYFDARAFNVPSFEIYNNLIWRQQDAIRNSIQMLAQANFSHKELQGKNLSALMDKLVIEKGINWNNLDIDKKRGACCYKKLNEEGKSEWYWDKKMLILSSEEGRKKYQGIFENKD